MNNLSLFLLGLVLINMPACLSVRPKYEEDIVPVNSQKIFPWCINSDNIEYIDDNWGLDIEHDIMCRRYQCFSQKLRPSYPCCKGNKVVYTDKDGDWGVENGVWCGIGNGPSEESDNSCFSVALGYKCCESCKVVFTDKDGEWGVEHNKWCGIKDSCTSTVKIVENPVQNATNVDISKTDFEFQFLKMENNKKNMLYSPLSIEYALKMLQEGAAENTFTEINKVIGNTELSKYESIDKNLSLANGLFIRDIYYDYVIKEYISTLVDKYDAEVIKDPFKSAQNANKWIEDKTLGIIKNILSDEVVQNPDNGMLIINALAIDMEWVYQFSFDKTYGEIFHLDNGEQMSATMMFIKEAHSNSISYYKDSSVTVLSMDLRMYNETQFEFMAIMPNGSLSDYVKDVTLEQIKELDKKLKFSSDVEDGVNVRIPKFKFDYDLNLKQDLTNLGIKDAFDKVNANFSKMFDLQKVDNNVYVSEALHKADIEFTEKGVKAAAVTVFVMGGLGAAMPRQKFPVEVRIDKPFMFVIRDKNTKDIWFTGTVYKPNSWNDDRYSY